MKINSRSDSDVFRSGIIFESSGDNGYDEYLAENVSSGDEGISSAIQNALYQLILNQAVTALKNGADEMIDVLYEDTQDDE